MARTVDQRLLKALAAEKNEPLLPLAATPAHLLCLAVQRLEHVDPDRLSRPLAFAEHDVARLLVQRHEVHLLVPPPPAPDALRDKGQDALVGQAPQVAGAALFEGLGGELAVERGAQLGLYVAGAADLEVVLVGKDVSEPEPRQVVRDVVQAAARAWAGGDRHPPLDEIQVFQRLQVRAEAVGLYLERAPDVADLAIAGGDRLQDRKIGRRLADLAGQQKARLVIERAARLQDVHDDLLEQVLPVLAQQLDVARDAAGDGIERHQVVERAIKDVDIVGELQRPQAQLPGAPPVERAACVEHQAPHHAHQAAAQDQHDVHVLELLVPQPLDEGGIARRGLGQVLELVDYQHRLLAGVEALDQELKERVPVPRRYARQERIAREIAHRSLKAAALYALQPLVGQEIHGRLVANELLDQRGLAHPPPAIDHDQAPPLPGILAL